MAAIILTLPDGARREVPAGTTAAEVARSISPSLAKAAVVASLDGRPWDLAWPIEADAGLSLHAMKDAQALELISARGFDLVVLDARMTQVSGQHVLKEVRSARDTVDLPLLVIVDPRGDVQNRLLLTDVDYTPSQLVQSANYLNQNFAGLTFDEVRQRLGGELRQLRDDMGRLMAVAVEAGSEAMAEAGTGGAIKSSSFFWSASCIVLMSG